MTDSPQSVPPTVPTRSMTLRGWLIVIVTGLAAGLITWAAGESLMVSETGTGSRGGNIPASPVLLSTRNGMSSFGILGGLLGLGFGLAGGLIRGSTRSAGIAGLLGLILGGIAGAFAARGLVPYYFANYSGVSLSTPLIVHGGIWTAVAVVAGLAFGLGYRGPSWMIEATVYAILGAIVATFVYEFSAIWFFPAAQTDRPLPVTSASRLFAHLVIPVIVGATLALGATRARHSKTASEPVVS